MIVVVVVLFFKSINQEIRTEFLWEKSHLAEIFFSTLSSRIKPVTQKCENFLYSAE